MAVNANKTPIVKKMKTALARTNMVGIPIVVVYFFAAVSSASTGFESLKEAWHLVLILLGIALLVILFFVWLHNLVTISVLRPAIKLLYDTPDDISEEELGDLPHRAITSILRCSLYSSVTSLVTWPAVIIILVLISRVILFTFPTGLLFIICLGAWSGGVLVAIIQFYYFKKTLKPELKQLLLAYPRYIEDEDIQKVQISLRVKMLFSFLALILISQLLSGIIAWSEATNSVQAMLGEAATKQAEKIADELDRIIPTDESIQAYFSELEQEKKGKESYFLVTLDEDSNAQAKYPTEIKQFDLTAFTRMINPSSRIKFGSREAIVSPFSENEKVFRSTSSDSIDIVVVLHIEENDWYLIISYPWSAYAHLLGRMVLILMAMSGILIFVSIFFIFMASSDVIDPIRELLENMKKVASGDLSEETDMVSMDEIGTLAVNYKTMVVSLREMIGKIAIASESVDNATELIGHSFKKVSDGSRSQSKSVDDTTSAMDEMNASIRGIAESVETLATSAQESSASIMEMGATIEEVTRNVEDLSASVEETTSSISEMAASIKQVAGNVDALKIKSGDTVASVTQMESSIGEVKEKAEQTASLSEQVAKNAEEGFRAVQDTIEGIQQIRQASEQAVEVIDDLRNSAEEIGNILGVIDEVTSETDLLALNAAIIAAQAGEHGRGFSVVSDEIKDLAERTKNHTQEIANLIEAVQRKANDAVNAVHHGSESVERGVSLSQQAGETLREILDSAHTTNAMTRDIAAATIEQAERARDVNKFFEEINDMIKQVSVAMEEQSKGSEQIMRASERMREIATQVKRATQEQHLGSKQIMQAMDNINQIVSFINSSQNEQIKNTESVQRAMHEIREIAQQNEIGVDEMSEAGSELGNLADQLREMVEAFSLGNGGNNNNKEKQAEETKQA